MFKAVMIFWLTMAHLVYGAELIDQVVAIVDSNVITARELDKAMKQAELQKLALHQTVPNSKVLRKQTLQQLINIQLELQLAKQNHMVISDKELTTAINTIADNHHLSLEQLKQAVQQQGLSWKNYQENIRKEILISQVQQKAITKEIIVTSKQIQAFLKSNAMSDSNKISYQLQNIIIPLSEYASKEKTNEAYTKAKQVLKNAYKDSFATLAVLESSNDWQLTSSDLGMRHLNELPDIFAKQVAQMKIGQIVGPLKTGNGYQLIKLIAKQDDNQSEIIRTHVRHILLKNDTSHTNAQIKQQLNDLYHQLKSGKNFAELAKKYSADITSAVKGGDLGWVNPGDLTPPFEQAMNGLAVNLVSKPIKSGFGWHLIEVLERKKVSDAKEFEQTKARQILQQRKYQEALENWQEQLQNQAYIRILDKKLT